MARGQRTERRAGLTRPFAHRGHAGPARPERSTLKQTRAPRLKRKIVKMHLCVLTRFTKARGQIKTETLRIFEPRGPDASPSGGPQHAAHASKIAVPPGHSEIAASTRFSRALAEILSKRAPRVWMISYSSNRARDCFFLRALGDSTVARWNFISILFTAKRAKSLFKRAGGACRTPN